MIIYENIPCPILLKKELDTFLILFKDEQKWIFESPLGYGEIEKNEDSICYFFNGLFHREYGPAVKYKDETKIWYKNGLYHREDGPAVEYSNGTKEWRINGKLHREDGPAIEYFNGIESFYMQGEKYSKKKYFEKIEEMKQDGSYNI